MKKLERHELTAEEDLLARIIMDNPGRQIRVPHGTRWGHYIMPAPDDNPAKTGRGLRCLVIASWTLGLLSFEAVKALEAALPDKVNIVGLVTDDPLDGSARISIKKRFWRYYPESMREEYELGILESALSFGIPCYTGEVKNDYFRAKLKALDPEVIVVSGFGQAIDAPIITQPSLGIYNVHPSDLLSNYGAGPQPWEDLLERQASSTRVSLHHVSETIDDGAIVGQSSLINVRLANGEMPGDVRQLGEKTLVPVYYMVGELIGRLIERKEAGQTGPITQIDFEAVFDDDFKQELMRPIDPQDRGHVLPLPPGESGLTV